jgi:hypothetical protein
MCARTSGDTFSAPKTPIRHHNSSSPPNPDPRESHGRSIPSPTNPSASSRDVLERPQCQGRNSPCLNATIMQPNHSLPCSHRHHNHNFTSPYISIHRQASSGRSHHITSESRKAKRVFFSYAFSIFMCFWVFLRFSSKSVRRYICEG